MNSGLFLPLLIILKECVSASAFDHPCPEAAPQMEVCLQTYLERDFTGLEPYIKPVRGKIPFINGPELSTHCNNLEEVVTCYSELDGSCGHLLLRMRFSYLLNGLHELFSWLCEENGNLKNLLENLHCIQSVRQEQECTSNELADNIWQQMLRLDVESEQSCRVLKQQLSCFEHTGRMLTQCGNQSNNLFVYGLNTWLQNWCIDGSYSLHCSIPCIIFALFLLLLT